MMMASENVDRVYRLKPRELHAHYMSTTMIEGQTAAEAIRALEFGKRQRASMIQLSGVLRPHKKQISIESVINDYDQRIEAVEKQVTERMMDDAIAGKWLAIGRSDPKFGHALIPPSTWPFLTLDFENRAAVGDTLSFRDVRCALASDVPQDHPTLAASQHTQEDRLPGRPTVMHLVTRQFEARCMAGSVEKSLSRESECLSTWFKQAHPDMRCPTPKTIANNLRKDYRAAISTHV